MASDKHAIRRRFDRSAAASYDIHARVQRSMADNLARSLEERLGPSCGAAGAPAILEIGCGTGNLTEKLLQVWPRASLTAIDLAPAMIEAAKRRLWPGNNKVLGDGEAAPWVRFLAADVEAWAAAAPDASFDLIVSNACFQWLSRPQVTLAHLRRLLRPGGTLAFTTFGPETFRELHEAFAAAYLALGVEPQRHGLSFCTEQGWRRWLTEAGFAHVRCERSLQTERYASVKDFLLSVKAVGASASEAQTAGTLGLRRLFSGMYHEYERRFSVPGGVAATYDLLRIEASITAAEPM